MIVETASGTRFDGTAPMAHAVLAGVVVKLAAEDHLEMRHLKSLHVAVDAVKADVGDVMLAAGVEAAADFDAQILHRLVELQALLAESVAQLARQTARRRDAQFAGVGPGQAVTSTMVAASAAPRPMALIAW